MGEGSSSSSSREKCIVLCLYLVIVWSVKRHLLLLFSVAAQQIPSLRVRRRKTNNKNSECASEAPEVAG